MGGDVRVQIYTMQSASEALAVAGLGVAHIGVTPARQGLPGEIEEGLAGEICKAMRGVAVSVALSVATDLEAIDRMFRVVRPDILHLCGPSNQVGPDAVGDLRRSLPVGVAIMQAIGVTGWHALEMARSYEPVVDYLILDSVDPAIAGIGASGHVHDWEVSAAVVEAVDVPVILAGGLSPDNVAEAIAAVKPWGVDSLTHTNAQSAGGGFHKDLAAVRRFVEAARSQETL